MDNENSNSKWDGAELPKRFSHKKTLIFFGVIFIAILAAVIYYITYPTCLACGKKTRDTMRVGDIDVPWCKEHQEERFQYNNAPAVTNQISANNHENTTLVSDMTGESSQSVMTEASEKNAERPYYGMDEQLINSTKIGTYNYKNFTVTLEGSGYSYTFIIDSRHAMLVKTANGLVVMVQYIEDGKRVLWSETSTGFHDWRH